MTVSLAYQRYLADPSRSRSQKTLLSYRTASEVVTSLLGADTPLEQLSRQDCRDLLSNLHRLPGNAKKRWPRLSASESLLEAQKLGMTGMSAANANGLMNKFSALLNWAVQEELLSRNPAKGLRLPDPIQPKDKRRPFSPIQLERLFNAPIFTGCENDEAGYSTPGESRPRRARFWVPLIGLFSGLRLNEICQMDVADVVLLDGVYCFSIVADCASSSDKHLKTRASERVVPIHPVLISIGFIDYVRGRSKPTEGKLFPELTLRYGLYSHLFSRWFGRFLKSCGAAAERTCFHSFRHNFRDALRVARVEREVAHALGGWAGSASVADRYGSGYEVSRLFEALSSVSYGSLDLSHLSDRALR